MYNDNVLKEYREDVGNMKTNEFNSKNELTQSKHGGGQE